MSEPVNTVEYDHSWPETFDRLRNGLNEPLKILRVEIVHVGSTSIPGAAAKPIIDLDVVIRTREDVSKAIKRLAVLGYVHQGDLGMPGRQAFKSPRELPPHHLYLVVRGNSERTRHLQFRDYLRKHPEATGQYSNLKKSLARKFLDDRNGYTQAKTVFITEILKRSEEEGD
jgi:GrpB-like predicted nucleotidyltransferase (UPF0157 family)